MLKKSWTSDTNCPTVWYWSVCSLLAMFPHDTGVWSTISSPSGWKPHKPKHVPISWSRGMNLILSYSHRAWGLRRALVCHQHRTDRGGDTDIPVVGKKERDERRRRRTSSRMTEGRTHQHVSGNRVGHQRSSLHEVRVTPLAELSEEAECAHPRCVVPTHTHTLFTFILCRYFFYILYVCVCVHIYCGSVLRSLDRFFCF